MGKDTFLEFYSKETSIWLSHLVHNFLRAKVNLVLLETGLFVTGVAAALAYIPSFAGTVAAVPTVAATSVLLVFLLLFSLLLLLVSLLLLGFLLGCPRNSADTEFRGIF
jgi:hypothetical protein